MPHRATASLGAVLAVALAFVPHTTRAEAPPDSIPAVDPPTRVVSVVIPADRTVEGFVLEGESGQGLEYAGDGFYRGVRLARFIPAAAPAGEGVASGRPPDESVRLQTGTLDLWLKPATDAPLVPAYRSTEGEAETRATLSSVAVNASDFTSASKSTRIRPGGGFAPTDLPSLEGSAVALVIITTDEMAPAFQELADLRTRFGVPAVVRTLSWITANYPDGIDLPERVRSFLRDAYSLWGTQWVLLGADTEILPVRFIRSLLYDPQGQLIATDFYYSCLDGNWNANGDSYFGEPDRVVGGVPVPGDDVDFYPELYVGRIPVTTAAEAAGVISKLGTYWLTPPTGYLNKLIYMAEVLSPTTWEPGQPVYLDGAGLADILSDLVSPNMTVVKMYQNNTSHPGSIPETKQAAVDSIQSGFGWVHHIGHGFKYNMSVGAGDLNVSDADGFTNGPRYCMIYAMNCSSAAVHYSCIGEHMLLNPDGGAVAFIGATDLDLPTISLFYEHNFYHAVFQDGVREVGRCLGLAKIPMIVDAERGDNGYRFNQFSLILLGDPTLPIYVADPGMLTVTHPAQFTLGAPEYTVHVELESAPVESALVCLSKGTDAYATAYTGASGDAVFSWAPHQPGDFDVSVFARDQRPYEGSATAVTSAAAHVYVSQVALAGEEPGAKPPNDPLQNGQADAGETVSLVVTLANNGSAGASGVSAVLRTQDPLATVLDSTAAYGAIPSGGSAQGDPFMVQLSRNTPDRHEIRFQVEATGAPGSWSDMFDLLVTAPLLDVYSLAVLDTLPGDNHDGHADAGETVDLALTLRNNAAGDGQHVRATLSPVAGGAVVTNGLSDFGMVPATSSVAGPAFRFTASIAGPEFDLTVQDTFATLFTRRLDLAHPATPTGLEAHGSASRIALSWTNPADSDLAGYHVYRADAPAGPFARLNSALLDKSAYFVDEALPSLSRFYYEVSAVDSSGNESSPSAVAAASTSPPQVAGWPVLTNMGVSSTGPKIADLDGDGLPEIVIGSGSMYALHGDGTEYIDGDTTAITLGIFSSAGAKYWSSPAIGDIDGDGVMDLVACSWGSDASGDEKVYVWDDTGHLRPGWPKPIGYNPWASPALGDLDGDRSLEIVVVGGDANIRAWHADGTEVLDGDSNPLTNGVFFVTSGNYNYGSPALADIDGDGRVDVIVAERITSGDITQSKLYVLNGDGSNLPGFPVVMAGPSTSSPAVADVNGDNCPEILVATNSSMRIYKHDGTMMSGWPKTGLNLSTDFMPSPAVGDLDGDGTLEVVLGSADSKVYAWHAASGVLLPGFPVTVGGGSHAMGSATIDNVDSDPQLEIVIPDLLGQVNALNLDGSLVPGFPFATEGAIYGAAAIADIDGDGNNEIVAYSGDKNLYALDLPYAPVSTTVLRWPMFRLDPAGTGWLGLPATGVDAPGPSGIPKLRPSIEQNRPNPMNPQTVIFYDVPQSAGTMRVRLRIFDTQGRIVRHLVDQNVVPGRRSAVWDGHDDAGAEVPSGVYYYRASFGANERDTLTKKLVVLR